jgi:hypothetical protein
MKAEPPAFFKMALSVIRALRDTLLICAYRLFQLGNPFKARIELNSGNALRWNRRTLKKHKRAMLKTMQSQKNSTSGGSLTFG